jgi:hypothetical protein
MRNCFSASAMIAVEVFVYLYKASNYNRFSHSQSQVSPQNTANDRMNYRKIRLNHQEKTS